MDLIDQHAELAVRVGSNLVPGQDVLVRADVEHVAVARSVAEHAYRAGARKVVVQDVNGHVRRAAVQYGAVEALSTARAAVKPGGGQAEAAGVRTDRWTLPKNTIRAASIRQTDSPISHPPVL